MTALSSKAQSLLKELQRRGPGGEPVYYWTNVGWMRELEDAGFVRVDPVYGGAGARYVVRLRADGIGVVA